MRLLLAFSLYFTLTACSSENKSTPETFTEFYTGEFVDILSANNLNLVNHVYVAESSLLNHMDSLFVTVSGQFIMEATDHEPHIEVFSYSNRDSLDGSFVRMSVNETDPTSMDVKLFTRDNVSVLLCTVQNAIAFNGVFEMTMQFDNFLSGGRVTLWNLFISPENRRNLNFDLINLSTASCSSQGQTSINRLGYGHRWGILTNYVKVHGVKRNSPYEL
jgi:hypothetical protein